MRLAYRVIVEAIDEDGVVTQRVLVQEPVIDDCHNMAFGIALSGAINGICVYDEPVTEAVVGYMLWRLDSESAILKAVGAVANKWEHEFEDNRSLDDVAAVVVLKDFWSDPFWLVAVDELPKDGGAG